MYIYIYIFIYSPYQTLHLDIHRLDPFPSMKETRRSQAPRSSGPAHEHTFDDTRGDFASNHLLIYHMIWDYMGNIHQIWGLYGILLGRMGLNY